MVLGRMGQAEGALITQHNVENVAIGAVVGRIATPTTIQNDAVSIAKVFCFKGFKSNQDFRSNLLR